MRHAFILGALALLSAPASAQTAPQQAPDVVNIVSADWQASQTAQAHLAGSVQQLVNELQQAREQIKKLEDENKKLKPAESAKP